MPKTAHFVNPWMVMLAIASHVPSSALCVPHRRYPKNQLLTCQTPFRSTSEGERNRGTFTKNGSRSAFSATKVGSMGTCAACPLKLTTTQTRNRLTSESLKNLKTST